MDESSTAGAPNGSQAAESETHPQDPAVQPTMVEVVQGMKTAIEKRCVESQKGKEKDRIDPQTVLTEKYMPQCWLKPRADTGNLWLEEAMFMFAHSRGFDYDSAAKRMLKFAKVAKEVDMSELDTMDADVADCLGQGCWYISPHPDVKGRPCCYVMCKHVNWKHLTVKQMQRASLWILWRLAMTFAPVPQQLGVSFFFCMHDFSMFQCKMEFETWITKVMQDMMPMKFSILYSCYEPFWFANMMYPWVKSAIKPKMRDRIHWLGNKEANIRHKILELSFDQKDMSAVDGSILASIPSELGGTMKFDPKLVDAEIRKRYGVTGVNLPAATTPEVKPQPQD